MFRPIRTFAIFLGVAAGHAAPLERSTFTEVVNSVSVIDPGTRKARPAREKDVLAVPEILRTGDNSRAELVAEDRTVTRVGSNTVFSFQPRSRTIELEKGSILFQSPSGKGGGSIRTHAASAAVLGTTMIVAATKNGGMKVLLLEGRGKVTLPGGRVQYLHAGQMSLILPGNRFSPVMDFRLGAQTQSAKLVKGFRVQLPSGPKILRATNEQQRQIARGRLVPGDRPPPPRDGNRPRREGRQGLPPPPPPLNQLGGPLPPPPPPPPPGFRDTATQVQQAQKAPPPPPPQDGQRPPPPRR